MARNSSDNSGCGCLILVIIAIVYGINKCTESKTSMDSPKTSTTTSRISPSSSSDYDHTTISAYAEKDFSEEEKKYLDHSLSTGATPYKDVYGSNYHCPYDQCSGIRVTAPQESDIVVIIKHNNQNGKVIAHGYIRAGATCLFDIPDGTYQTFFYYGKGWNPNKPMKGGVKGGFVKDELFSKDNPQEIYSGVLSYVLQLQRNGNFQTKGSNVNEVF